MRQGLNKFGPMELLLCFAAMILLTHYETFITGNVIVPPKPLTFKTLKEFVQNGFKFVECFVSVEKSRSFFVPLFNRSGILDRLNKSVVYKKWNGSIDSQFTQLFRFIDQNQRFGTILPGLPEQHLDFMRLIQQQRNCYTFEMANPAIRNWWFFSGHHGSNYFTQFTGIYLKESGIMKYWHTFNIFKANLARKVGLRKRGLLNNSNDKNEPKPVACNSIVMISLLTLTLALHGLACIIFLIEIGYKIYSIVIKCYARLLIYLG